MLALFVEFGPPQVLGSNNVSAFKAEVAELLDERQVAPLIVAGDNEADHLQRWPAAMVVEAHPMVIHRVRE